MSAIYLAFTGTPDTDDFRSSYTPHPVSLSAALEFFQDNRDKTSCTVARIPASTKNIDKDHYIWDDLRANAVDVDIVDRSYVIDAVKNGLYHNLHEQERLQNLEKSYNEVMRFKGRAVYYSLLILFSLLLTLFLPEGYFEIYFYHILTLYILFIAASYYLVHLGCRGWAREVNPPAENATLLIEELTI